MKYPDDRVKPGDTVVEFSFVSGIHKVTNVSYDGYMVQTKGMVGWVHIANISAFTTYIAK